MNTVSRSGLNSCFAKLACNNEKYLRNLAVTFLYIITERKQRPIIRILFGDIIMAMTVFAFLHRTRIARVTAFGFAFSLTVKITDNGYCHTSDNDIHDEFLHST
jgi:hypothetical protein